MNIWHYDPITKELLGVGTADPDPLNKGGWLHPAWTTTLAPPAAITGSTAVFGTAWTMVVDHRGETWWNTEGEPVVVTDLGVPAGLTNVAPAAPPVVVPPITVSAWQIRAALTQQGLRAAVEAYVTAADQATNDAWRYAAEFTRDNALINAAATALGKTQADVDSLFQLALTLKL